VKNYALMIIRRRWYVLGGWVLLIVLFQVVSGALGGANYKDEFKLPHTETNTVSNLLSNSGLNNQNGIDGIMVVHAKTGDVKTPPAGVVTALQNVCAGKYKVTDVASPWGSIACSTGGTLDSSGANPKLISTKDPSIGLVDITFAGGGSYDQTAINNTYDALKKLNSSALQVEFTGDGFEGAGQSQGSSLPEMLGFLAALIILSIVFRTFGAVAVPLLSAAGALSLGLALIAILTHVMSVSNVTPELAQLMVIGVGVDYALFIVTRHRRNLQNGMDVKESIALALNTSGRAVLFAGTTVCIAMLGLIALGVNFFYGMAIGVAVAVSLTMLASLTLLPAVLSLLGHRVLPRSQRGALPSDRRVKILLCVIPPICVVFWVLYSLQWAIRPITRRLAAQRSAHPRTGVWARWANVVAARKAILGPVAAGVIILLAIPFFSMRMGHADQGNDPSNTTSRKGYDLISQGFGVGYNSTLTLVVSGPNVQATADKVGAAVRTVKYVDPTSVFVLPKPLTDTVTIVSIKSTTSPEDAKTTQLVHTLRDDVLPPVYQGTGDHVYVYGQTAVYVDFTHVLSTKMPLFIGAVVLLSFLLLMIAFRSIVVPLTAAVMNLFAAGASFGIIVAIFQWGWGAEALGIGKGGPIEAFAPVLFFAILFGLSMDYQVFLVSRMHEEWVHTRDNKRAITVGQAETGGIITAAAIIMMCVFGGFLLGDNRVVKLIGLGLASAIFVDAFILRTVLVPSLMHLVGKANWWFPKWLDRITPRVSVEPPEEESWSPPEDRELVRT
jgi:putative drug exporter of the RND superfamily